MAIDATPEQAARFWSALENAERFFMGDAAVQRALRKLALTLEQQRIPYAIAGAMALNLHGYQRVTVDVDVLLTREGLAALKAAVVGLGYVEKFPGSKGLRDTENNVVIDVLITGEFPGDGKAKPVAFPAPELASVRVDDIHVLSLAAMLELKLASGMSAPHRLKDLADVVETIRALSLPRETAAKLDPWVRAKFDELWVAAQAVDPE
jgi:hypothetical protein